MYEWNLVVQKMIDWIEENLDKEPKLLVMSKHIGYSPYYCSIKFHEVTGRTLKNYITGRKLARAALEIRDSRERILDIALKYGFSSQEALTRAFVSAYGCTPAVYRRKPVPIPILCAKVVLFPEHYKELSKGEKTMNNAGIHDVDVRMEYIPAHKYMGIFEERADNYGDFWKYHDCDTVCGVIDSLSHVAHPIVTGHTAGWFYKNGKRCYFYGLGVNQDFDGAVPEGFEIREVPASYYRVFAHPAFDYLKDNNVVMPKVEEKAWNYSPEKEGYEWNEEACLDYQRHNPEVLGYEILRPVKKK